MGKRGFRDLVVWREAKDLAVKVCLLADRGELGNKFWLRDQICRSAISIASNIAEGDERDTDKEASRFFFIAKGSLAEMRTQIQVACESGCLSLALYENLERQCESIARMLGSLIKVRQQPSIKALGKK